jgi:hypothetical protein
VRAFYCSTLCECCSEVLCLNEVLSVSVLEKCFVRAFYCSTLCECCSEVLCSNVLVIFSLEI